MESFINAELIESVLSTVFDYFNKRVLSTPADRANFDFVLSEEDKKVAIEVRSNSFPYGDLHKFLDKLSQSSEIEEFILITPEKPSKQLLSIFNSVVKASFKKSSWLGLNEFLKKRYNIQINNKEDLTNLQLAAITSKLDSYSRKNIGNKIDISESYDTLIKSIANVKHGEVKYSDEIISLRRQFPDSILADLNVDNKNIINNLFIGQKYNNAIIVLSDIKNFSTIVSAADPEDLNEAMSKYYGNARDLVFKYNGILDKFIGDAVLAIFNYPKQSTESYINTIKFCSELILLGNKTFDNLLSKMDQAIETGTRIGVSNGPIYSLNIGQENIEVTFIGDKINFASRLEKNCDTNGILISNRFFTKISVEFRDLVEEINIINKDLSPSDAKGQILATKCWQILESDIEKIIKYKFQRKE